MKTEDKKICLDCGEPIIGRADKKFCNDLCRNNYNNRLNSDSTNLVRNINHILRRNRRILEEMNPTGKSKVLKQQLISKGFNFNYFTNIYHTKNGNTYYFCYEQAYLFVDEAYVALVVKQDWMA